MTKALKRRSILLMASAVALGFAASAGGARAETELTVLFICERGYAKSLVAALHFERLAASRGFAVRAQSRGADPGESVPAGIVAGLAEDGFDVSGFTPARATREEIEHAAIVVLIGVDMEMPGRAAPVMRWDGISPLSEDYRRARGEIVDRASDLLDRIAAGEGV